MNARRGQRNEVLAQAPQCKHLEKQRTCLNCGKQFASVNPGNRICLHCKKNHAEQNTRPITMHAVVDARVRQSLYWQRWI